jgi:hypothetical protein
MLGTLATAEAGHEKIFALFGHVVVGSFLELPTIPALDVLLSSVRSQQLGGHVPAALTLELAAATLAFRSNV